MLAGMELAQGDAIVIMDVDLQDPPELVPKMIKLYEEGYENIYTRRRNREGEATYSQFFC